MLSGKAHFQTDDRFMEGVPLMLSLIKDRPLVFFDLETTGTNVLTDRIVELSVVKLFPDGTRETKTRRINPEMHIPEEASEVHGIYDEDVKDAPTFRRIAQSLYLYLEDCDLGGYNIVKFDVPVLVREFQRAGLQFETKNRRIVDAYYLYCKMEPRTLKAAYKTFCGKNLDEAHSAEADTLATVEVFEAELKKYSAWTSEELPEDVEFTVDLDVIHNLCNPKIQDAVDPDGRFRWKEGEVVVAFGRNSGQKLKTIAIENPDFLRWILKADFSQEVKKIASDALKGYFPEKQ